MNAVEDWLDYSTENCSIQRTLDVIGERWSLLILREAFNGVRRFEQLREHLGIADAVLSRRLHTLVDEGVLAAVPYREPGRRTRHEYRLTETGLDLYPVLIALLRWGDRHRADPEGPAVDPVHRDCGAPVDAVVTCTEGHRLVSAREGDVTAGPAARRRALSRPTVPAEPPRSSRRPG